MKIQKIIYWVATVIMLAIFAFSASMYFSQFEMVSGFFEHLGFPTWMIYPLATLKVLGIIAVVSGVSRLLMEWAYAGFFFDAVAAFAAHIFAGDGAGSMAIIAILATIVSRALLQYRNLKS